MDNITLILFVSLVAAAGFIAKPKRYWLVCIVAMLAVLGLCELWAKSATGLTLSQQQELFTGWRAVSFNVALFGGFIALFVHLNWKRWNGK